MGLFRGAVSRLGAVLGTAALLSAAACGTEELPAQVVPMEMPSPPAEPVQVRVLTADGETDCTEEGGCASTAGLFVLGLSDIQQRCRSLGQWREAARTTCASYAATLREVEPFPNSECGEGLIRSVRIVCEGALAPEPPPDEYSYTGILGGADQCRSSADWAQLAAEFCGPHHAAVQVSPEQACGEGQTRYARVTCRWPLQTLPVPAACTLQSLAGLCALPEHWSLLAAQHCATKGQTVGEVAVAPGRTCGVGGFDYSWVTCCGPEAPPEPPTGCFGVGMGGSPSACQSAEDWRQRAQAYCASAGATLQSSIPLSPCGGDTFGYTSVTCCP